MKPNIRRVVEVHFVVEDEIEERSLFKWLSNLDDTCILHAFMRKFTAEDQELATEVELFGPEEGE